jgi:hypothetical protein
VIDGIIGWISIERRHRALRYSTSRPPVGAKESRLRGKSVLKETSCLPGGCDGIRWSGMLLSQ